MDIITECFFFLSIHWHCCDKLFKIFSSSSRITSKFVALHFMFCKLRRNFGFFCSVNHFSGGGVNTSHNAIRSPSLACKNKTENGEGNRDGDWNFCQKKEEDIALFSQVTGIRMIRKKLVDYSPKLDDHRQWTFKHRNKPNRLKSTNHKSQTMTFRTHSSKHVFPKRSPKMIDRTETPKFPSKFAKCSTEQYN